MSVQYDLYLEQHKGNVAKGFKWLVENLPELFSKFEDRDNLIGELEHQICFAHDVSKNKTDEYEAYDAYFYGGNRSYQVVQDFNRAWLLHVHRNPHHWQHWVLINDDPNDGEIIPAMPFRYIIEMICDWWAFSWQNDDLYEIFGWYEQHKDYMKLSFETRNWVDMILRMLREKLDELNNIEQ